jgi:membrane protease YdiL (CAAX protease family)
MRESGVERARRGQQAFRAAVLVVALVVSAALATFVHGEKGEQPRVATVTAAVVPASMVPVLPDARPIAKRTVGALVLLVAVVAALMLGVARRFSWSAAARAGSPAVLAVAVSAVRGRAPPRRTA